MDHRTCMGAITSVNRYQKFTHFRVAGREDCRVASSSKDSTIKVWDTIQHRPVFTLSGHTAAVTCLRWGGKNWIYSGSQDKSIRIWDAKDVSHSYETSNPRGNYYMFCRLMHIG